MILFVSDNSGILFIKGIIQKVVEELKVISRMVKELIVESWMN